MRSVAESTSLDVRAFEQEAEPLRRESPIDPDPIEQALEPRGPSSIDPNPDRPSVRAVVPPWRVLAERR